MSSDREEAWEERLATELRHQLVEVTRLRIENARLRELIPTPGETFMENLLHGAAGVLIGLLVAFGLFSM
ncbi:MAG TPA: hypothetical protein VNB23_08255 [Ramlibacter sp.]|nr:hypothetical protein [Ramlibacter sp.]